MATLCASRRLVSSFDGAGFATALISPLFPPSAAANHHSKAKGKKSTKYGARVGASCMCSLAVWYRDEQRS